MKDISGIKNNLSITKLKFNINSKVPPTGINQIKNLKNLIFYDCNNLENLNGLETAENIETITIAKCTSLTDVSALYNLKSLKKLQLKSSGIKKAQLPKEIQSITEAVFSYN
jgi:hypothetical protein